MPRFIVRVGFEWVTPCYREAEVDADDAAEAEAKALARSDSEPEFWTEAIDCDGEARPAEILGIDELDSVR